VSFEYRQILMDGNWSNPLVIATVLGWTCWLSLITWAAARDLRSAQTWLRKTLLVVVVATFYWATPLGHGLVANLLFTLGEWLAGRPLEACASWEGHLTGLRWPPGSWSVSPASFLGALQPDQQ